jgi:putative cell wall-binding protein
VTRQHVVRAMALACGLALACGALALLPASGFAWDLPLVSLGIPSLAPHPVAGLAPMAAGPEDTTGPKVTVAIDPPYPTSYFGWYSTPARVSLTAERPSQVWYRFGDTDAWTLYTVPFLAPEGKNMLEAFATDSAGISGRATQALVKVDYSAHLARWQGIMVLRSQMTGGVTVTAMRAPSAGPHALRLGGADRYGTCCEVVHYNYPSAQTIIVARGDDFPDALSAAGLAGVYGAPVVLAHPASGLSSQVRQEIVRIGAHRAIIVGSSRAVPASVEGQLRGLGLVVERIGGLDRYETASMIAAAVVARGGARGSAFVARGDLFPDSLAMSPAAYEGKVPILLVRPSSLPAVAAKAIGDLAITNVVIAGSEHAVSGDVALQIAALTGAVPARVQGADRYGTASAAADYTVTSGLGTYALVGVATGLNFPDALCGGAALGQRSGVLVLTPNTYLSTPAQAILSGHGGVLREVQVYGSEAAVAKPAWDSIISVIR